ncbi:MAG: SPOR domain-containing protein [Gammaproteobacteria bacterium]|nr:SPOR domain-containing protein [Gammaproteobacteria bacterium]
MEPVAKQRIVGGLVLIALALIIIPLMIDFSQNVAEKSFEVTVPAAPDEMKMTVLPLQDWSQKIDPAVDPQAEVVTPTLTPRPAPPQAPETSVTQGKPATAAMPAEKAVTQSSPTAATEQWMVQASSFTAEDKAKAFSDRLKGMGYPAFYQKGNDAAGAAVFRVRVGPVADRAAADSLLQRLKRDAKVDGLVMRYSSN